MKRPFQYGFLALALTGVSTYNVLFFKDYNSPKPPEIQSEATPAADVSEAAAAPGAGTPEKENLDPAPSISREELQRMAQHAFAPKKSPIQEATPWPDRDPFSTYRKPKFVKSIAIRTGPSPKDKSPSMNLPEPECVFSGTLIEQERRLALINGIPLAIGAQIGAWQIARIESDYVILRSGEKTRRIEFTNVGRPVARKEPL